MPFDISYGQTPLTEKLLLIAIDRTGRLCERPAGSFAFAAAGAMLTDLLDTGVAAFVDGNLVAGAESRTPLGEVFLRELDMVPPQSVGYWVNALTLKPFMAERYAVESLRRRGAIAVMRRRLFGVWPATRYDVRAVDEQRRTLAKIMAALTSDSALDLEAASLITLAASCGVIRRIVARPMRGKARLRLRQIAQARHAMSADSDRAYAVAAEVFDAAWSSARSGAGAGMGGT